MKKEFLKHKLAYSSLLIVLFIIVLLYFAAWPNIKLQRIISIILALFYFLWGILTHLKSDRISKKVIFEYFLISLLAALILVLITF